MDKEKIEENLENMVTAVGAISELMWFLFSSLKSKGFNDKQSMKFCLKYMEAFTKSNGKNSNP